MQTCQKTVDVSKQVRKATNGNEGSGSSHADGQNQLQQEASTATASQVHGQLAKPGREADSVAAAGQVYHQLK